MTKKFNLTSNVWREDDMFIAQCLEFDVASQGHTVEEALDNLREAVQLFLEPPTATVKL
jgi:predicted RNase H-like HicB family nuclease